MVTCLYLARKICYMDEDSKDVRFSACAGVWTSVLWSDLVLGLINPSILCRRGLISLISHFLWF